MISLSLGLTENPRGPGLWKLNPSFLTEEEYINRIKKVTSRILKTSENYEDDNDMDDAFLWEMIKLLVKVIGSHQFKFFGNEKAKSRQTDETKHYDNITYLEKIQYCPPFILYSNN